MQRSLNKQIKEIIADVASLCVQNNITFRLEWSSAITEDEFACSGYFDESSLVVATKKPKKDWITTLLHESCHMDQWLSTDAAAWVSDEKGLLIVEEWLKDSIIDKKQAKIGFRNTVDLELDCEKRTVQKIKYYDLKISTEEYIQKANAYLFSYVHSFHNKKWYPQPYEKFHIWSQMPKTFLSKAEDYFKRFSKYKSLYSLNKLNEKNSPKSVLV